MSIPHIENPASQELLEHLYPGSSVANPIDFLATGNAEQLGIIIDYVDNKFDEIDAMIVIFGTAGLTKVFDVYNVLNEKMKTSIRCLLSSPLLYYALLDQFFHFPFV